MKNLEDGNLRLGDVVLLGQKPFIYTSVVWNDLGNGILDGVRVFTPIPPGMKASGLGRKFPAAAAFRVSQVVPPVFRSSRRKRVKPMKKKHGKKRGTGC